jgi:site-specific recombinase XerD
LLDRLTQGSFAGSYSTFSRYLEKLAFDLPSGERTHVLRHTFASHFMMNGGNILTLQKVLGHSSLDMTMRYAHLSPDYLQEVVEKNPVALTLC